MEPSPRRKIRITDRDPYVYHRARAEAARFNLKKEQERQKKREERYSIPCDPGATRRKQSSVLGLMFAALALVIFTGTRIAAPRLQVTAHGGDGVVLVDSVEAGRTGDVLHVKPGFHQVTVRFDDERFLPEPRSQTIKTGYTLTPVDVEVNAVLEMTLPQPVPPQDQHLDGSLSE